VLRQLDLFATGAPSFDEAFRALRRTELSHGAWVDYVPSWVAGQDALFEELERDLPWRTETMQMYDKIVDVPRLLAAVRPDGAGQPLLGEMRDALSARYGEQFVHTTAALYRDGRDSVAMHGDTTARNMLEALVATVSLGEPRRFAMRSVDRSSATLRVAARPGEARAFDGGESFSLMLGRCDLVVMGGSCQRTWRHGIPKAANAGPRIAIMFRPAWARNYRTTIAGTTDAADPSHAGPGRDPR